MKQHYSLNDFRQAFDKLADNLLARRQFYQDSAIYMNAKQCSDGQDWSLQVRLCEDLSDFAQSFSSFLMSLRLALEQATPEYHVAAQSHLSVLFHLANKVIAHKLAEKRSFREVVGADYHLHSAYRLMLHDMSKVDDFHMEHLRYAEHLLRVQGRDLELKVKKPRKRWGIW